MSIRVGESWQARNGHRRWVSMPLADVLALGAFGLILFAPLWLIWKAVLLEAWLAAELVVFLASAILALVALARREAHPGDVTMTRLRWGLWMVDLRGRA